MRCINGHRLSEVVGTVALVLLVTLPKSFGTNDDVSLEDPADDCGDSSARSSRPCGGGNLPHQATDVPNDLPGGAPRVSRQQYIDRVRRREMWKNFLLHRAWNARGGHPPVVDTHLLPQDLHPMMDRDSVLARLLPSPSSAGNRDDEQEPIAKNRVYLPHCSGPRNFTGHWNDGTNFRLYFNVESAVESSTSSHRLGRETRILSAYLYLKRKITPTTASLIRVTPTTGRTGRQSLGEGQTRGGQRTQSRRRGPSRGGVSEASRSDGDSEQLKVIVYMYSRPTKRTRQETKSAIRTVLFNRNTPGWLRINLTSITEDWLKRPLRNVGIQVTVQNEGGTEELHPNEYFDGFNCTQDQSPPAPADFPLWTVEENLAQSSIIETIVDLDMNITQPYLDVITTEAARSRPRHQHDLS